MKWMKKRRESAGFVLPAVIFVGIGTMILGVTSLEVIRSSSTSLNDQYYRQLAKEASQAGASVASGCVTDLSNGATGPVSWWSADLTPQTSCTPGPTAGRDVVAEADNWRSTYRVATPTEDSSSLTLTATGTVTFYTDSTRTTASSAPVISETTKVTFKKQSTATGATSKYVSDMSIGTNSMCAVAEGKAYCWGDNTDGQLGDGTKTNRAEPVAVATNTSIIPATAGTCVRNNLLGRCVEYSPDPTPEIAVSALAGKTVTKVARGVSNHTCAIAEGKAYCWGDNDNGQLGNRTKIDSRIPVPVYDSPTASAAVAGVCRSGWDLPLVGCMAWQTEPLDAVPASPLAGKTVTDISVGADYTCAIASGQAICWGANGRGQLGTNNRAALAAPKSVYTRAYTPAVTGVCKAYFPFPRFCISWDPPASDAVPASVMHGKTMVSISAGTYHTCAFDSSNIAYCWGKNEGGQLGNGAWPPPSEGTEEEEAEKWSLPDGCSGNGNNSPIGAPQRGPDPSETDELQPVAIDAGGSYTKAGRWGGTRTIPASPFNGTVVQNIRTAGDYTNVIADGKIFWFGGPDARSKMENGTMTVSCTDKTPDGCYAEENCSSRRVSTTIKSKYKVWDYSMNSRALGPLYENNRTYFNLLLPASNNYLRGKSIIQTSGSAYGDEACGGYFGGFGNSCTADGSEGTFCALTTENRGAASGMVYCDGPEFYIPYKGNLGDGTPYRLIGLSPAGPRPVKMNGALDGKSVTKIAANRRGDYTCVIADNAIYCWGINYRGRLGTGKTGSGSADHNYEPTPLKLDTSPMGNPGGSSSTIYLDPVVY